TKPSGPRAVTNSAARRPRRCSRPPGSDSSAGTSTRMRTSASPSPPPFSRRGGHPVHPQLTVGNRFPDLELPDHLGKPVRLSALAGEFPLIVSFYRGYW